MRRFAPFEPQPQLAVAVSGGSDSMALAHLAHSWATLQGGTITALTIDHGLRTESASDAAWCKQELEQHGIACHVLTLQGLDSSRAVQEQAREARYHALSAYCHKHHLLHLLIAHHADDQWETHRLRHASGSGAAGLAGMSGVREMTGLRLLRPLLAERKETLRRFLESQKLAWREDASNRNPRFARNRLRQEAMEMPDWPTLQTLGAARHDVEAMRAAHAARYVHVHAEGFAELHKDWRQLPAQHRQALMAATMTMLRGGVHPPRKQELERLVAWLAAPDAPRRTLGGIILEPLADGGLRLVREPKRLPESPITHDSQLLWDGRFLCTMRRPAPFAQYHVAALGHEGLRQLRHQNHQLPNLPRHVLLGLPALWVLDEVQAVPHIAYESATLLAAAGLGFCVVFAPAKPLAAAPFSAMVTNPPLTA